MPHEAVTVVIATRNRRASARTAGVRRARTRYVALNDDDSWWEPGALARGAGPRLSPGRAGHRRYPGRAGGHP
jgi:hypothetical protein